MKKEDPAGRRPVIDEDRLIPYGQREENLQEPFIIKQYRESYEVLCRPILTKFVDCGVGHSLGTEY